MVKGLDNVCKAVRDGKKIEREVERVIEIVKGFGKPVRAKEVAELLTQPTFFTESGLCPSTISHATKMLTLAVKAGALKREEVESEPITIKCCDYGYHANAEDTVMINGVEYVKKGGYTYGFYEVEKEVRPKIAYFSIA